MSDMNLYRKKALWCSFALIMILLCAVRGSGIEKHFCLSGNCRDGWGECRFSDFSVYKGNFLNGMRDGKGEMDYPDGSFFSGNWKNDRKEGEGMSLFADGSEFRGTFCNDEPHGEGIFIASDGSMKKLHFRSGKMVSWVAVDFEKKKEGFRYGTVLALGGVYTGWYAGKRAEGFMPHGRGRIRWDDGALYAGQWLNGKMHGRGVMKWPDGSSYMGEWVVGRRHGFGTYTWKSGSKYMGGWKDNRKHGIGIASYADGSIQRGMFHEDVFTGPLK